MSTTQPIRNLSQLQEFKNYYYKQNPNTRNYVLCILGLNTALRITDTLHLKWNNIYDFNEHTFFSHISITESKTGKSTMIALNPSLITTLDYYQKSFEKFPQANDYLFQSRKGINQPLSRSQAFRIIKQAALAVGLNQHVSCHSLRKTFGYHAWQQGIPPVLLMDIYNHSSYRITKRYLGIEQDDKDNVFLNIVL